MYITVDIGGTKTLLAVVNDHGEIVEENKFPTPKDYDHWLLELRNAAAHLEHHEFKAGGIAAPGRIDRNHGRVLRCGNLPWKNVPLQADAERVFKCPVVVENDANLAGLSESMLHPKDNTVLYITVSTGIGTGVASHQKLDPSLLDSEGGHILLQHKDSYVSWEKLSAGSALHKHFGKNVGDILPGDKTAWKYIAHHIAMGLLNNIAIIQPDIVIVGGSVGSYFKNYGELLQAELEKNATPVVKTPRVIAAQRPERCVTYGCYDLAKQKFGHAS
jgi:predicted NBD/HSP70 family sugar kinase